MIHITYTTRNDRAVNEVDWSSLDNFDKFQAGLCSEQAKILQLDMSGKALDRLRVLFPTIPTHPTRHYTRYTKEMATFIFNNL